MPRGDHVGWGGNIDSFLEVSLQSHLFQMMFLDMLMVISDDCRSSSN